MWWLQLVGVIAFAVVVVTGVIAWRRDGAPGTSRAYMVGLIAVCAVVLAGGAFLVAVTYGG